MVLLVWVHLLAAISWIGGTIFLSVVLVPVLKSEPFASQRALLFRTIARRFRVVVWGGIAVLLFTGPLLLHQRGIPITDPSAWPVVLAAKLELVTILLLLTLTHRSHHRASRLADRTDSHGEPKQVRSDTSCVVSMDRSLLIPPCVGGPVCRGHACADLIGAIPWEASDLRWSLLGPVAIRDIGHEVHCSRTPPHPTFPIQFRSNHSIFLNESSGTGV